MAEKKSYPEFQKLLRDGIGTRTQKEFADETGITKETINRWLNNTEISQPGKESLQRIAKHVKTYTLNQYYVACGYPAVTLEEDVMDMEQSLKDGLNQLADEPFGSISSYLGTIETLWLSKGKFERLTQKVEVDEASSDADYAVCCSLVWTFERKVCMLDFKLYYAETKKGKVIVLDSELLKPEEENFEDGIFFKNKKCISFTVVAERKSSPSMISGRKDIDLCETFFGDNRYVKKTTLGFGFYLKDAIPENFKDYMYAHANSFCNSSYNCSIFNAATNSEDITKYFTEIMETADSGDAMYPGDIIAEILSTETKRNFVYYVSMDKEVSPDVVMIKCASCNEINKIPVDVINAVYKTAKELGIPEFGACYFEEKAPKIGKTFVTKDFHIEF